MYVLVTYVPEGHIEKVKNALFEAGGGAMGAYSRCSWQVKGQGQFKPEQGSTPFIGEVGETEKVAEFRLEMVCADERVRAVEEALKKAHPYEEPAYHFLKTF